MFASLRGRLTFFFAVVFAGLGVTLWLVATLLLHAQAERETDELLQTAAKQLRQEWQSPEAALDDLREDGRFSRVTVTLIGKSGTILGTSHREVAPWPRPVQGNDGWRVRPEQIGDTTLVFGVAWRETERLLRRQSQLLAGLTFLLSVLATVLARLVIGRTLRPIGALAAQAEGAAREVELRSPSQDAELCHLVTTLNGLLVRQRRSARAREEFAATASHELRTPLTVLLGTLEVALSRPRGAAEYQETLGHLQAEVQRMARLTESLLLLSRLDGQLQEPLDPVNLTELCREILASLEPQRESRALTVQAQLAPSVVVETSSTALAVVIRNLFDNAHRHAPRNTVLQIALTANPVSLTLRNATDPAIQNRGAGLGLTLCQRLSETYGWCLRFQRQEASYQVILTLS